MSHQKETQKYSLKDIEGLGPDVIKILNDIYIFTPQALAMESAKEIAIISGLDTHLLELWIEKAKELIGKK